MRNFEDRAAEWIPRWRLLERGDLAGEVALVAIHLVLVNAAGLCGAVEDAAHFAKELGGIGFLATGDGGTDALEFAFDGGLHLAVTGGAADGLACAFCGGFGIGHKSVFSRKRSAEAMNRGRNVNRRLPSSGMFSHRLVGPSVVGDG